jgi:class 3 adenylate cyclase
MRNPESSRSMRNRLSIAISAVALVGAAACGAARHTPAEEPAMLYFTNESLDQADVYAVLRGNQPIRIGTVMAGRTDTLVVPRDLVTRGDNVNVVARLLARSAQPSSGPIPIHPGDRYQIRLPVDQKTLLVLPGDR